MVEFNAELFEDMVDESGSEEESTDDPEEEETVSNNKRKVQSTENKSKKVKYEDISEDGKKKSKNHLYKAPTVEELNELKETENLFNNNLFRLQIQELVSEIGIKNKRKKFIANWFEQFKNNVEELPEYNEFLLSKIKPISKNKMTKLDNMINKLSKHKNIYKTDQDVAIKLLKPEGIETFGLYVNNSLPGPNLEFSIMLKMPQECFCLKDYQNNRYLTKKYYYLLYIYENLLKKDQSCNIYVKFHENNMLIPILNLVPKECDKVSINIHIVPTEDYFKPSRFLPKQNNFKADLFEDISFKTLDNLKNTATVMYNSTLLHDYTLSLNNTYIKTTLNEQTNIQEGVKLLLVWMRQRELNNGLGSLTEDLVLYLIVYLTTKRKINKHMSSYQVIRNFWSFIINVDLYKNPISICENVDQDILNNFKEEFDIIILDKSGCYNVAAHFDYDFYKKVQLESELALKHLDDNRVNSFHNLFITRIPFYLQYDLILNLKQLPKLENLLIEDKVKAKNLGHHNLIPIRYVKNFLKKGLDKRILNLVPRIVYDESGSLSVLFGINLNPENAFNIIILGPSLDEHVVAEKFRQFWGNLASDRRFRDGTAKVSVYFKTRTIQEKRAIIKKILKFLLEEKLKLDFSINFDEFEQVLVNKKIATPYPIGTNEECSLKIITASDELGKKIRELKMSLAVTGIQGISDVYSYSEVFPPIGTNYKVDDTISKYINKNLAFPDKKIKMIPRYVQPIECVLQLEHSSKWPSSLEGIRHIKTQFYLEISKLLRSNFRILTNVTREYLDVFYEGLLFRYKFYLPKEVGLIKRNVSEDGVVSYKDSLESFNLEKNLSILPRVNGALKGLQSQHPSYGPGTALIKRWFRSQLIDDSHFPDIVINLLNASLYLNGTPFLISNTPQGSFLRFLKFISEFEWNLQSVLVNFNDEISNEDITELDAKLQQKRDSHQPLYIITPFDKGASIFTKNSPTKEILFRVKQLALSSLNFYSNIVHKGLTFEVKELFTPNWTGYNALIHLHTVFNPRRHEQINNTDKTREFVEKYNEKETTRIPISGFNPVQMYLDELRTNYGEFALFFHDTFGGNTIGLLWRPKAFEIKDFKVTHVNGRKLEKDKLVVNTEALLEDMHILGKDLVKTVEIL